MSVFHVFPYRASELPRSRSTRGPPEPLRPPRQQPHPGTLRPAARPPPPLPQENTSVTFTASFLLLTLGMNSGPFSQKERANFQLSSDNQSSSEAPVTLRNHCLQWMRSAVLETHRAPPLLASPRLRHPYVASRSQHCPSVGQSGTRFTVTDLSSRQAVVRKAGLWRRQRGFSCAHLPWEKHSRRSLRLKAATWECSCVWTHPNGLQLEFSTYSACCRSAV